jgi:hypothetical protein
MRDAVVSGLIAHLAESVRLSSREGISYLTMPLLDAEGEPIELALVQQNGDILVHDGGKVAASLFSTDQESENSVGFKLARSMTEAYEVELNFDAGVLQRRFTEGFSAKEVWRLAEIVCAVSLAVPHLPAPRGRTALGTRLRGRVRSTMKDLGVLGLVEQRRRMQGRTFDQWMVDFYYKPNTIEPRYDVAVATLDLDVQEPVEKAEHAITLAMDVKEANPRAAIRVVYDTHGHNSLASQASSLINAYGERIGYEAYDYRSDEDHARFIEKIEEELLPPEWAVLRS